ncbi:hypothetical protein K502DRAFT_64839 [Neoconidiobolus thromboides FSU 785]|nr:hypothetical protein K502DRAFT_64839 [Neoconidiobolus thromboides FSU 785]
MKLSLPDIQEVEAITTFNGPLSNERNIIPSGNIQKLKQKMNKLAKVTITDGRSFIGTFTCADKQGNVVLAYSTEYRGGKEFTF